MVLKNFIKSYDRLKEDRNINRFFNNVWGSKMTTISKNCEFKIFFFLSFRTRRFANHHKELLLSGVTTGWRCTRRVQRNVKSENSIEVSNSKCPRNIQNSLYQVVGVGQYFLPAVPPLSTYIKMRLTCCNNNVYSYLLLRWRSRAPWAKKRRLAQ